MLEAFEALAAQNPHGLVRMKITDSFAPYHAGDLAGFPPAEAMRLYTREAAVPADDKGRPIAIAVPEPPAAPVAGPTGPEIPDGWETSHHLSRMAIAKQLLGRVPKSVDEADETIRAEVERRKGANHGTEV